MNVQQLMEDVVLMQSVKIQLEVLIVLANQVILEMVLYVAVPPFFISTLFYFYFILFYF